MCFVKYNNQHPCFCEGIFSELLGIPQNIRSLTGSSLLPAKCFKTFYGCKFAHLNFVGFFLSLERPKIYEKETDFGKVVKAELRSKHEIQCTASGNPEPRIEWKWQPCSLTDTL